MYGIKVIYDTGDTFHQEHDVEYTLSLTWENLDKAKQALKDIEEHYHCYMICKKEWNAGKKEIKKARDKAMKSPWCSEVCSEKSTHSDYWNYSLLLENDEGERVDEHICWTGYFESMVGADIINVKGGDLGFRL